MIRSFTLAAAVLAAGQASALSCMRPDAVTSYQSAAGAEESYVVLWGDFTFEATEQPEVEDINAPEPAPAVVAGFEGRSIDAGGFGTEFTAPVTLEPSCLAAWCGGFPEPGTGLAFARIVEDRLVIDLGPCGGWFFQDPAPEDIARVEACNAGGACEVAEN